MKVKKQQFIFILVLFYMSFLYCMNNKITENYSADEFKNNQFVALLK